MFGAMQRQGLDLVIGGVASVEDVDRTWIGTFKMPIGPFGMMEQIGFGYDPEGHCSLNRIPKLGNRARACLRARSTELLAPNEGMIPPQLFRRYDNRISRILEHELSTSVFGLNDPASERRAAFLENLTSKGFLGVKTNRDFYLYPNPAYARPDFLQIASITSA